MKKKEFIHFMFQFLFSVSIHSLSHRKKFSFSQYFRAHILCHPSLIFLFFCVEKTPRFPGDLPFKLPPFEADRKKASQGRKTLSLFSLTLSCLVPHLLCFFWCHTESFVNRHLLKRWSLDSRKKRTTYSQEWSQNDRIPDEDTRKVRILINIISCSCWTNDNNSDNNITRGKWDDRTRSTNLDRILNSCLKMTRHLLCSDTVTDIYHQKHSSSLRQNLLLVN